VGALTTMVALHGVIGFLYCGCGKNFCVPGFNLKALTDMPLPRAEDLLSKKACTIVGGWMAFQVLLERCLPAQIVEGTDLASAGGKGKLPYRINGHLAFWVSMALAAGNFKRLSVLYDEYLALAGAATVFSTGLSFYLYAKSFTPGALLARGGNSGNAIYDFFIGRELNPRIGKTFDWKEFCELRPGLIGWALINLGMAAKQFENTGRVSGSMIAVNALQGLYVWDALFQERAILSTMDITTDGFGFMLAFGDLAWVPFTYGLQARYLVDHDPSMPPGCLAFTFGCGLLAYYVFRASNGEKDAFRRDPKAPGVQHLKTLEVTNLVTGKPSKLLISGWWGMARKINYTADWLMAWSWSSTCGLPTFSGQGSVMAYFYPIYFAVLLTHRAWRDDEFCSEKYGKGWIEYKKRVPYVFFPYIV
jgi:delta14-sterol reductase/lamin-B receptor